MYLIHGCLFLQVLFYLAASIFAYKTYKILNHGNWWWMLSVGFFLMSFKSFLSFFTYTSCQINNFITYFRLSFLPFIISVLILCGMIKMYKLAKREHNSHLETKHNMVKLQKLTKTLTRKRCLLYEN